MIDFAHVYPATLGQPDSNYIFGLNNLIEQFQTLSVALHHNDEKTWNKKFIIKIKKKIHLPYSTFPANKYITST